MALFKTGSFILNTFKPNLLNPCFVIPSTVNIQSRNAARKGYRDKQKRLKKAEKVQEVVKKEKGVIWKNTKKVDKTIDLQKPEAPKDDVFIIDNFNHVKFSLSEAVKLHREYHDPTVSNNPEASVQVTIELSMYGKRITQVLKPFSGVAPMPHPFVLKYKKSVLVICDPEDITFCLEAGASIAGGQELVKKIQGGIIQPSLYEYIICHVNSLPLINPIRGLLKNQVPKLRNGTVTKNLKQAINKFLYGVEYTSIVSKADTPFAYSICSIGTINMELPHLEENFKSLLADIMSKRPSKERPFITWIWCESPPSPEKFAIDLSLYIQEKVGEKDDDDDDDDVVLTPQQEEKLALRKLREEAEELSG